MTNKLMIAGLGILIFSGCAEKDGKDQLKERAQIEQEQQTRVERQKVEERAQKMESELAERHYFYSAMEGRFAGTVKINSETYNIRFTFARSIPAYVGARIREVSEIENDLNNLFFYIQIVQWHTDYASSAVGCNVAAVRPNMGGGQLVVASADCPNLYSIRLSSNQSSSDPQNSTDLALKIKNKDVAKVEYLSGFVQPSSISGEYEFHVQRVP